MIYRWRFYEGFVGSRNLREVIKGEDNPRTVQRINEQASKTVGTIVARVGLVRAEALACAPRFAKVEVLSPTLLPANKQERLLTATVGVDNLSRGGGMASPLVNDIVQWVFGSSKLGNSLCRWRYSPFAPLCGFVKVSNTHRSYKSPVTTMIAGDTLYCVHFLYFLKVLRVSKIY